MKGRFAPSPTGPLHVGNLRTALVSWISAAAQGGTWIVRMEDLDPLTSSLAAEQGQLADLLALGLEFDDGVVRQSERFAMYRAAIAELGSRGLVYSCFCTRREIREAASAPNDGRLPDGAYPGTCRDLTRAQISSFERQGRTAALRLRTESEEIELADQVVGHYVGAVDDVVLQRNDGVPAYNLAVVVDDHEQTVTEVVRGDDLVSSTPRQLHLQRLLGFSPPSYAHVPLVLGADGARLAKRHGAVTLADLASRGIDAERAREAIACSLGLASPGERPTLQQLVDRFTWTGIVRDPWVFDIDTADDVV